MTLNGEGLCAPTPGALAAAPGAGGAVRLHLGHSGRHAGALHLSRQTQDSH